MMAARSAKRGTPTFGHPTDAWMNAPTEEALTLQRPLADGALTIVAGGERQDAPGRPAPVG